MAKLDWERLKTRYRENPVSHTKTGEEFRIVRVTERAAFVDLPSRDEYISRKYLEKGTTGGRFMPGGPLMHGRS